jgi:hypothetical protein
MKNFIFLVIIICLAINHSCAQEKHFGIFAGANMSYFTKTAYSSSMKQTGLIGAHIGVFAQKNLKNNLSGNATLGFSRKGMTTTLQRGVMLDYVNLASNLRYNHKLIFAEFGPELGFLVNSLTYSRVHSVFSKEEFNKLFGYKKLDLVANMAIGAWVTKTTSASFRVSKGFIGTSDVIYTNEDGEVTSVESSDKNLTFQLSITQLLF